LIPLALEYYLGVIEINEDDYFGSDSHEDDSDGDKKPKKKKKEYGPDGKPADCK